MKKTIQATLAEVNHINAKPLHTIHDELRLYATMPNGYTLVRRDGSLCVMQVTQLAEDRYLMRG